jgi:hypothetical protein
MAMRPLQKNQQKSVRTNQPTPYPEVNAVLQLLLSGVQAVLGDRFVGMYLYGSLASGDFDKDSDVDAVVVTDDEISGDRFSALQALHARIASTDSVWATQLEVSYIPQHALRRYDPADRMHPHIDRGRGESLRVMQHDSDWVIQRHVLREQGVVVTGPPPQGLIYPVQPSALRRAVLEILRGWWAQRLHDPAQLYEWGYQPYAVLTMCRILYTLKHGTIVSKPVAARWARKTLEERWASLIERAVIERHNPPSIVKSGIMNETLEFIRFTLEQGSLSVSTN